VIFPEESGYGWGVGKLPMPRNVVRKPLPAQGMGSQLFTARKFFRDLPWRSLLWSSLLTIAVLLGLLYLGEQLPPIAHRAEPAPVRIVVQFRETPPAPASTPAVAESSPPQTKPSEAPQKVQIVRAPVPKVKEQPPPPAVVDRPETTPVPPAAPTKPDSSQGGETARPEPELPRTEQAVRLNGEAPAMIVPGPDLRPQTERPAREQLPAPGSVVLGGQSGLDLATAGPGPARPYSRERREGSEIPQPAGRSTLLLPREETTPLQAPTLDAHRFQDRGLPENVPPGNQQIASLAGSPELEINPPAPTSSARKQSGPNTSLPAGVTSFDYLDRVAPAELDRNRLLSLNQLSTCRDPQAEMRLRTRLATLVSKPGTCRSGGVVFVIRQPESAWSIHLDIYNYGNREFGDRCAALQLALECHDQARR
jgi:hypothetical protein